MFLAIALCATLLFSCQKPPNPLSAASSAVLWADHDDAVIAQIAEDAQNTLPGFFQYLTRNSASGGNHFYVKYPFMADEDSGVNREQVWLTGIHFKNGLYYGTLANTPRHLSGMKKGDKALLVMDSITDWMYIRDGNIIGGDSIRYLLEQIPENQRSDRETALLRMFY